MARRFLGIELVSILHIPLERRLQTVAVCCYLFLYLFFTVFCGIIAVWLWFTRLYFIPLLYAGWFIYDYRTPERGGRRCEWIRSWKIWQYCRDYFPVTLKSTASLDPNKNYLMLYHPHGIICSGTCINFGSNATGFRKLFPGIRCSPAALNIQFLFPFCREYVLSLGFCSCSKESIEYLLTRNGPGNAVVLVVGGASEALEARPGSFTLTLKQRKGFVRIAMQHGIPLVPVFGFGENDLYEQVANPVGSRLRRLQTLLTKYLSFSPPLFHGRGILNYTFGLLPFRHPVNVVVGSPLEVAQVVNPTEGQIDQLHQQYIDHLVSLFEAHKSNYGISQEQHLNII